MPCVSSGHVLSETAGAHDPFVGSRLISSRHPAGPKGACIDGEDRVFAELLSSGLVVSVRTFCPAAGFTPGSGDRRKSLWRVPFERGAACAVGGDAPPTGDSTVDRAEKKEAVATLHEVFSKASVVVVAHYSGLTVAQMQNLRKQMKQAGARVQVAKNRLAKIALEGTDVASVGPLLKGPALIAYSDDPVAAPKVAVAFAKDYEKFVLLGGAMGKTALNVDGIKSLATLPSLDELRAKLLGLLQAPATKLAQLSTAPAAKLARVFGAYASKDAA
jgi:large subunit ribosomal protein L10